MEPPSHGVLVDHGLFRVARAASMPIVLAVVPLHAQAERVGERQERENAPFQRLKQAVNVAKCLPPECAGRADTPYCKVYPCDDNGTMQGDYKPLDIRPNAEPFVLDFSVPIPKK